MTNEHKVSKVLETRCLVSQTTIIFAEFSLVAIKLEIKIKSFFAFFQKFRFCRSTSSTYFGRYIAHRYFICLYLPAANKNFSDLLEAADVIP